MPSKPFNIMYLSSFGSLKGGGQVSLFHLVTNLDRAAFCPYANLPADGDLAEQLRRHGIEVIIQTFPRLFDFKIYRHFSALYNLLKLIGQYKIDLLHSDGPRNTLYAGIAAKIKGIPLIWHVRAFNRDRFDHLLYLLSTRLILVANSLRSRFDWIRNNSKFVTIYNGVSFPESEDQKLSSGVRQAYGIEDKTLLIAVIARIEPLKGQKYLIEACGSLKGELKDFHVILVGDIADSEYLKECKESAAEFGIQNRITFSGYKQDVNQILNEIDIFVLPSLFEAFPRSLIEAMGAGKPVVATDVGGCAEAVEDTVSGFIVPPKNPEALAERVHMLGRDTELRRKVGRAARSRAEEMFSMKQNVKQTELLYREVLKVDALYL
jgi:glycosyltransferase involved in cell wall biosynthesis